MYKIVGINPAEKGSADALGSKETLEEAKKVADSALPRYDLCEIHDGVTGEVVESITNTSKAA